MEVMERFLKYVTYHTTSNEESDSLPSTQNQFVLAHELAKEMKEMGLSDVIVDDHCYVYGMINPSEGLEDKIPLGLIAHMDTSPDASGKNVKPQIITNYDGKDVVLPGSMDVLKPEVFHHLNELKGRTLITTDGTTLLGADNKAGIAEILTVCQQIITRQIPHGPIYIAFTPDEEVGRGMDGFDLNRFKAQYAYTVDGGAEGEIEFENFNAATAKIHINGISVHPGDAKNSMVNAALVGCELNAMLPSGQIPSMTEAYEGFYHLVEISGDVNESQLTYIIRDHSEAFFQVRLDTLQHIVKCINEKYGKNCATLTITHSYQNMAQMVKPNIHLIENARKAIEAVGLIPVTNPIRGGTDGARLSYMGIPCPNLGTGGYAYHGKFEHITKEGMELSVAIVLEIIKIYAS